MESEIHKNPGTGQADGSRVLRVGAVLPVISGLVMVALVVLSAAGCLGASAQTVGGQETSAQTEEDFVPTEEVSADRSVSFPVDI